MGCRHQSNPVAAVAMRFGPRHASAAYQICSSAARHRIFQTSSVSTHCCVTFERNLAVNPRLRLTPSSIARYEACPKQFELSQQRSHDAKATDASPQLAFGNSLHEWLLRFHAGGGREAFTKEARVSLLNATWQQEGYTDAREQSAYLAEACWICDAYAESDQDEVAQDVGQELYLQTDCRLSGIPLKISGKIDR